jgi:hypothetical protein
MRPPHHLLPAPTAHAVYIIIIIKCALVELYGPHDMHSIVDYGSDDTYSVADQDAEPMRPPHHLLPALKAHACVDPSKCTHHGETTDQPFQVHLNYMVSKLSIRDPRCNIQRDSGNIRCDSGNIRRDSGNIRRDSENIRRDSGNIQRHFFLMCKVPPVSWRLD